jgi:hypothetical protein
MNHLLHERKELAASLSADERAERGLFSLNTLHVVDVWGINGHD